MLRSVRSAVGGILDFECVSANSHAERWLGCEERPLVRKRLLEEAPWTRECGLFAVCVRVAVRREPEVARLSRQSPVGTVWLLARVSPWEDGAVLFLEDLTERMAAEEALRRDHDLLHAVIESATDAVYVKADRTPKRGGPPPSFDEQRERARAEVSGEFDEVEVAPDLVVRRDGAEFRRFFLVRCRGYRGGFPKSGD